MSKTWKEQPKREDRTPQDALNRIRMSEAKHEIREALTAPQEATSGR
jgi:hypothetical protein